MKKDYRQLLKPEIINSISGLSLISRLVVDGHLSGHHHSRRLGSGMEFSQYRGYEVGDDLRLLDWKMLARSGRYYIKQSEVETHISVKFVIDASQSMQHEEQGLSKIDFARVMTASLAWLAHSQGDAVGLYALNNYKLRYLQPKVQKKHFNRLLQELINIETEGKWPANFKDIEKIHNRNHKELIFFITDLHEETEELSSVITKLKTSKNEVVVLHILGKNELDFNYEGALIFEDLESGVTMEIEAEKARTSYLKTMTKAIDLMKQHILNNAIHYQLINLNDPLEKPLQMLLKTRQKLI
ncbi:DUF58 domain-containing protein [Psychroflexus tropicus]|uniref:DUF58 domain-containing protein n=1 Tax=Psychroflexus tropicus TaxID=197345 RepID=UPI000360AB37|nr:DUF58 domain-containing protein [Psychroflexus tropicus]